MIGLVEPLLGYASLVLEKSNVYLLVLAILIYTLSLMISSVRWITASRLPYSLYNVVGGA